MEQKEHPQEPDLSRWIERHKILTGISIVSLIVLFGFVLYLVVYVAPGQPPAQHSPQPTATPTTLMTIMPTPTLALGQKAIYTYYINVSKSNKYIRALVLEPPDSGKTFQIPVDTPIYLNCQSCTDGYHMNTVLVSPQHGIIEPPQRKKTDLPVSLGIYTVTLLRSVGEGTATITLITANWSAHAE